MKHGLMLILSYGSRDLLVSDEAGEGVLAYAKALARKGGADHVEVMVNDPGEKSVSTRLLLGPGTHLMLQHHRDAEQVDLHDLEQIAAVRKKIAFLDVARPVPEVVDKNYQDLHEFEL
jgi:hypothetical protein